MSIQVLEHQIPILEQLAKDRDKGKTLVVIPSGAGKTHISAFDSKAAGAKNILYLAHRREILRQAARIFQEVHEDRGAVGFLDKDSKDFHKRILFATNSTLSHAQSLEIVSKIDWDYLVIDEFHHVAADSWKKIADRIKAKFVLGLTATDYRLDKKDIMGFVDNNLSYKIDLEAGIEKGILVPFHYNGLHDDIDYSDIVWQGNKYRESDLNKKLLIDKRDNQIVDEFLRLIGKGHSTIAFCVNIPHTQRMVDKFTEHGISCKKITHRTAIAERDITVKEFRDRKFDVLFVRDVFNEGVDFPQVEAILLLRPTWSKNVFFQQLGRGLRRAPNKTHVTVLDFIGNYNHAFDRQEWLKFAEKSEEEMEHRLPKPMYEYDIPYVHFSQKVVEIFEFQRHFGRSPSREDLKKEYFRMKDLLGRIPRTRDFEFGAKHGIQCNYTHGQFQYVFGTWYNFLQEIGEADKSKQQLVDEYFRIKNLLGHRPSQREFMRYVPDFLKYGYARDEPFGFECGWNEFLKLLGEKIESHLSRNQRLNAIKEKFASLKSKNNKIPNMTDFVSESEYSLIKQTYGNYVGFLVAMGEARDAIERYHKFRKTSGIEKMRHCKNHLLFKDNCKECLNATARREK